MCDDKTYGSVTRMHVVGSMKRVFPALLELVCTAAVIKKYLSLGANP